jgi:hypothetical protein
MGLQAMDAEHQEQVLGAFVERQLVVGT